MIFVGICCRLLYVFVFIIGRRPHEGFHIFCGIVFGADPSALRRREFKKRPPKSSYRLINAIKGGGVFEIRRT